MSAGKKPLRTCLGCGSERTKGELLRFVVAPDGAVVADTRGRLPGRGAYTCANRGCIEAAKKKKQFNRAFRGEVPVPEPETIIAAVRGQVADALAGYLSLAAKAGNIVSGSDMVADSIRSGKIPGVLFIASDISEGVEEKLLYLAGKNGVTILTLFDKDRLGQLVGKGLRSVVAIAPGGLADAVLKEYEKFRNFFDGGLL